MARTFNCGLGMVLVVAPTDLDAVMKLLPEGQVVGALRPHTQGNPKFSLKLCVSNEAFEFVNMN